MKLIYKKYPGLYKLVTQFHKHLEEIHETDFDAYILMILMYGYTCKYLKSHNKELTKENIYQIMEDMWSNGDTRTMMIQYYRDNFQKTLNN